MDVSVKIEIELGPKTLALFLNGGAIATKSETVAKPAAEVKDLAPAKETVKAPEATKPAPPAEKKAPVAPPAAKKKDEAPAFDELDEDAQLETIKAEVTKHTKKGKSADIKALLAAYDAGRASELAPEQYSGFFNAVKRYGAGEAIDEIVAGVTAENDLA